MIPDEKGNPMKKATRWKRLPDEKVNLRCCVQGRAGPTEAEGPAGGRRGEAEAGGAAGEGERGGAEQGKEYLPQIINCNVL